jgi:hypothetical protein
MEPKFTQHLRPAEMLALARSHVRPVFADKVGTGLLLVRLDDESGDLSLTLEAALEEASTAGGLRLEPAMGYDTMVGSLPDTARSSSMAVPRTRAEFGGAELHAQLLRAVYFAAPLRKRRGASNVFSDRISVGRARTNDIVLRHHTVSKFHAWFECDENDRFYLSDAKSTNATLVNGTQIPRSAPAPLSAGDEIRFGDVVAILCTPEILWDALVGGPPSSRGARR